MTLRFEHLPESEYSKQFFQGMLDRMAVSYFKYGPIEKGFPDNVDAIGSLMQRLREYARTGNTEYLMDAANFAMIEFMRPRHEKANFTPTDDSGSPGRIALKTGRADKRSNDQLEE